jgi:hypothetical protein
LQIPIARWQPTRDKYQRGRVQCRSLIYGLPIAGLCRLHLLRICGGKESAPAQRRDAQTRVCYQPTGFLEPHLGELFAPNPDPTQAGVDTALDRFR